MLHTATKSYYKTIVIEGILYSNCIPNFKINNYVHVGANNPPSTLSITSPATLTWLPPAGDLNCSFNYTVNINSFSVIEQMYSNSTSLIPTDLACGENYSFAVAVTDSTGQHGPWSEELRVTWDGELKQFFSIIIDMA